MIDLYQVLLISGVIVAILLTFVIPLIFQNRKSRISRFFRNKEDIRFQIVKGISKNPSSLPEDLSHAEMIAILMIISVGETVSHGFASAQRFSTMGWANRFNEEFLDRLNTTARAFASKQWYRDSLDLFRLGQMIANANNLPFWESRFAESINGLNYRRVESNLPTRQL